MLYETQNSLLKGEDLWGILKIKYFVIKMVQKCIIKMV